jgi:hypothetical protein
MTNNVSNANNVHPEAVPPATTTAQSNNSVMQQISAQLSSSSGVVVGNQSQGSVTINNAAASKILNDAINPKNSYFSEDTDADNKSVSGITI